MEVQQISKNEFMRTALYCIPVKPAFRKPRRVNLDFKAKPDLHRKRQASKELCSRALSFLSCRVWLCLGLWFHFHHLANPSKHLHLGPYRIQRSTRGDQRYLKNRKVNCLKGSPRAKSS